MRLPEYVLKIQNFKLIIIQKRAASGFISRTLATFLTLLESSYLYRSYILESFKHFVFPIFRIVL
jgi:hypothetical protein